MDRRHFTLAALAAAVAAAATPAWAKLYYNPDTNQWEERTVNTHGHGRYSAIPREVVPYETKYKPGTIIVETSERRLYFVLPNGEALRYGIGVGRDGFRWSGQHAITRKAEWPGWTPPAEMRRRVPDLPAYMPGGPDNPLGARALYIGATLYRIHGTSEPWTIGQAVSSGCIRLTNEDIIDLYDRVKVGSLVVVRQ
ncbi:MAG TPA: L,D-transpeptidase [Devosia sp.]|nr:L,D-transpeptidase [Devosia sp.]